MENVLSQLIKLIENQSEDLAGLKKKLSEIEVGQYFPDWIPRKTVMQFLDYGDTQMAALLKEKDLVVSEVGARKFIEKKSFLKFLEKNIRKTDQTLTVK